MLGTVINLLKLTVKLVFAVMNLIAIVALIWNVLFGKKKVPESE
ncbi:hypothetical protein [Methanooceanicella nereidis]|nr:hypothetical protein [Methanocella sp. CWC-04]